MVSTSAPAGALPEALLDLPPFLMLELLRHGRRRAQASPEGPRLPHVAVMAVLDEFGPLSQREVAERLRWDPSDLVSIVDDLEADGRAVRERDPVDRRRNRLRLTPEGWRWLRERVELARGGRSPLLPGLTREEGDQLTDLLRRALAAFDDRVPARYRGAA